MKNIKFKCKVNCDEIEAVILKCNCILMAWTNAESDAPGISVFGSNTELLQLEKELSKYL